MSTRSLSRALLTALAGVLLLTPPLAAQEQSYTVFGRVRDATSGDALTGVQVVIRGTGFGALTGASGEYSINAQLAPGTYTLEAAYIGREAATADVTLGAERMVRGPDFQLRETALELQAVVVTGTAAPTAKRAIGNSVSTVQGEELTESPAITVDAALQGKVAGAVIQSNTGTPGGGISIRLRGTSSIVGGAEPLIIVDGVIIDNNADQQLNLGYRSNPSNRLADLDPDDIESVEVLKGAAAAALYGSRANNGVIQIFTKRGAAGEPQITAYTRATRSDLPKEIDFALTPVDPAGNPVERFDHQDLLFRDVWGSDSYLSVAGGSGDTQYYLSGNWVDQKGIMIGSAHQKLNVRMNLTQDVTEWLELFAGANYIRSHSDLVANGEQGTGGLLTAIVFTPTTTNLAERDPDTGEFVNPAFVFPNPLQVVEDWSTPQDVNRFVGAFQARSNPWGELRLEYRLGYDTYAMETAQFIPRGSSVAPLGRSSSINRRSTLINNDLVGNLSWGLAETVQMTTSAGMNHTYTEVENLNLGATDLVPLTEQVRGIVQTASEGSVETVTFGVFGQQQLAWNNRVFLTGALRVDASSTFGEDERWQLYPKLSGSWVLSEEPFWQNARVSELFSELRLRGALGYAGNQPPLDAAYARFRRFTQTNNVDRLGLVPLAQVGNPELRPERQREYEVGLDAAFLDERLGIGFTYYDQRTEDLLLLRPFVPSAGYASILDNVGVLSNWGIEVELNAAVLDRDDFGWRSRLIYSANNNSVDELVIDPYTVGYTNRVQEGLPLGAHYMSAFERNPDGSIVTDETGPVRAPTAQVVGNPWPDFNIAFSNDLRFGDNVTGSFLLDGAFGHQLWNQTQRIMDIFGAGPLFDRQLRGEVTDAQRRRIIGIWEAYLEDADYVKLRELSLRYSTDADFVRGFGVDRVELELMGRNLYTWTDYTGYDPEINMFGLNTVERGVDFAVYPNPRTYSIGLRLNF